MKVHIIDNSGADRVDENYEVLQTGLTAINKKLKKGERVMLIAECDGGLRFWLE